MQTYFLEQALSHTTWYWIYGAPLVLACWLGASYLRKGTWRRFVRGPGGAILKGGAVASAVALPLSLALNWHTQPDRFTLLPLLLLGGAPIAAVFAAILSPSRPAPLLGAFAGGGIAVGLGVLFFGRWVVDLLTISDPALLSGHLRSLTTEVIRYVPHVVLGAIAGSFAGRWEPEPLPDE